MRTSIRVCRECRRYTLHGTCPQCGRPAVSPLPPRYSPEDRYGDYRRRLKQLGRLP